MEFLGNPNGNDLEFANNEAIRIIKKLEKKYPKHPNFESNIKDSLLYKKAFVKYEEDKEFMFKLKQSSATNLSNYRIGMSLLKEKFNTTNFNYAKIDSLYKKINQIQK